MKPHACITTSWDDGHPSDLRLAEMLAKYNLPGTFYVPRSSQRPTMSLGELGQLASGFELGAHTLDHMDLPRANRGVARQQIAGSKAWLEDVSGQPCTMFCPPLGHFTRTHLAMIRDAGYAGIRTVELMSLAWPWLENGLWIMPTTVQAYPHGAVGYLKNAARRLAGGNLWRYIVHGRSMRWDQLANTLASHLASGGGVFHLWGHSWELEETRQWQHLEEVLRLLSAMAGQVKMLTNSQVCHVAGQIRQSTGEACSAATAAQSSHCC